MPHHLDRTTWAYAGVAAAIVLALAIGYFLAHVPYDVGDHIEIILDLQARPVSDIFLSTATMPGYVRPVGWVTMKSILELSNGAPIAWFRSVNILTIAGVLVAAVRLFRIRSMEMCAVALLCLVALVGHHPFHESVRETWLNHHVVMPLLLLTVMNLCASEPRRWHDAAVLMIAVYATWLVETGLLVAVLVPLGYVLGWRGVSRRTVVACVSLVPIYMAVRFLLLDQGVPSLMDRTSGFGFAALAPAELQARFGDHRLPLYAYNVVAAALTVLFSEPRAGVFTFTEQLVTGGFHASSVLNVVVSTATTAVLAWFTVQRWSAWRGGDFDDGDRVFLVSAAMVAGNAAISFPYLKDVVMNTGTTFYALAMFPAFGLLVARLRERGINAGRAGVIGATLIVLSCGWTVRAALLFVDLRSSAFTFQNNWSMVDQEVAARYKHPLSAEQRTLVRRLQAQSLAVPVPRAYRDPAWVRALDAH